MTDARPLEDIAKSLQKEETPEEDESKRKGRNLRSFVASAERHGRAAIFDWWPYILITVAVGGLAYRLWFA